eukprot:CAMPEP_0173308020 /NCGR_PEP_ID=MMETSP1143-20121109/21507_1 /TAXON_ID=483371 /ORGANISM="non described non described, Strain CCMP2298" /LENGTH=165 /DNA_ID=CAMNT_0014249383 /DNA_START=15 /DNA_END=512 /DNA_ORIENTATION=+
MSSYGSDESDYSDYSDYSDVLSSGGRSDEESYGELENDLVAIEGSQIFLKRAIEFRADKPTDFTEDSLEVLAALRDSLLEVPARVNIWPISADPAQSKKDAGLVKRWLVKNGLQSSRITTKPSLSGKAVKFDYEIIITALDKAPTKVHHKGALPIKESSKTRQAK